MSKTLQLTFLTTADKKVTLSVEEPKINLSQEEVTVAMDEIIQSQIFAVDDHPFVSAYSAKVIERSVTDLLVNE